MTKCHCFCPILTDYDMPHSAGFVVAGQHLVVMTPGDVSRCTSSQRCEPRMLKPPGVGVCGL